MKGTLPTEAKIIWQEHLPTLVHAYNSSHSNMSGFSPFDLMYSRQPMLPINVQFGVRTDIVSSIDTQLYSKAPEKIRMDI